MKRFIFAVIFFGFLWLPQSVFAMNGSISASTTSCTSPCNNLQISWDTSSPPATSVTIMEIYTDTSNNVTVPSANTSSSPTGSFTYSNLSAGSHKFRLVADGNNNSGGLDGSGWSVTVAVAAASSPTSTPTPTTAPSSPTSTPTTAPTSAPGVSTVRYCNESCGASNQVCQSGLYCATLDSNGTRACRLQTYQSRSDCSVPSFSSSSTTPTPTTSIFGSGGGTTQNSLSPTPSAIGDANTFNLQDVLGARTRNTSSGSVLGAQDTNWLQDLLYPLIPALENNWIIRLVTSLLFANLLVLAAYFLGRFIKSRLPKSPTPEPIPVPIPEPTPLSANETTL